MTPLTFVRSLCAIAVAALMVLGFAAPAYAHDPIFVTDDQKTPDIGPFMPDGSISWALYGTVLDAGDTRGFEFDLREGDEVFVSLLIPNLEPEVDLGDSELPIIELEAPDGSVTVISPVVRDVFDEPFSNTSYVTLAEYREPAQAGRYRGLVIGNAPSRFSVAIGETEIFFTETERSGNRPGSFAEITVPLTAWYTTPPGGEPDTNALAEGEAEIQLDMIEEAMESGEADAPAGSLDTATEPTGAEESPSQGDAPAEDLPADEEPQQQTQVDSNAPVTDDETIQEAASSLAADGDSDDSASSTTWVAPVVVAVIAVLAGGAYAGRRRA